MKRFKFFSIVFLLLASNIAKADMAGAIAGGLIGSQFGGGNGRIVAAALGAVIGDRASSTELNQVNSENYYYPSTQQTYVVQQIPTSNPLHR